jgi:transketolase C-terminal domain/subunit
MRLSREKSAVVTSEESEFEIGKANVLYESDSLQPIPNRKDKMLANKIQISKKEMEEILKKAGISDVVQIDFYKIEIGFTNTLYNINNKYILKICSDEKNEKRFDIENYFVNNFVNKIPVPNIQVYDKSKSIINRNYILYEKIDGENLSTKWHLLDDKEKREVVRQICSILQKINETNYEEFANKFSIDLNLKWKDFIQNKIKDSLQKIKENKILAQDFIFQIEKYINKNIDILNEEKKGLIYWDLHFDNFLIKDNEVVGILDFERTEIASLDYVLNMVRRMSDLPGYDMAKQFEHFAEKKDYENLFVWFEEFYPELFKFENLQKRLDVYILNNFLRLLVTFPDEIIPKESIAKIVDFNLQNTKTKKVGIIVCGEMVSRALFCVKELESLGIEVGVMNLHTIKPIDQKGVAEFVNKYKNILTCEEHQIMGGMGSAVLECLATLPLHKKEVWENLNFNMLGVENRFGQSGTKEELFAEYGLDEKSIIEKVKSFFE